MRKTNRYDPDRKQKFCDPGACDHCKYLGNGDFQCTKHQKIVVANWETTNDYMICKGGKKRDVGK